MTREIVPKRKIRYPMGLERDYAKLLTAYVARKMKVAAAFIPEMKEALQTSNMTGHINVVLDQMEQAMESADVLTGTMQKMARLVEAHTEKETDAEFRSVFSLSAPLLPGLLKNQPVTNIGRQDAAFPDLEELKQAWVDQNLDLIRSIDRQTLERIKQQLNDAIIYNSDAAELTKFLTEAIQEIAHNETNRAVLIATDQIGKLHGRMSQYRQEQAGITHYIWETAHDSRVRPWHHTRQGKKFAWSNPPPDGHPGIPIRCRCVALPVIDVDKIPIRVKPGTFIAVSELLNFMAHHRFKPSLAKAETKINVATAGGKPTSFLVHQVRNSEFTLFAEDGISPRDDIIRTVEELLREAADDVAGEVKMPPIIVADLEKAFGADIMGGYDYKKNRLFLSSKYDTREKILAYVQRNNTQDSLQFANQTVLAPILHELGHDFYYSFIKEVAKERKIPYNKSKELINTIVKNWGNELILQDRTIIRILSKYADAGFSEERYTETVAEIFSVRKINNYAKDLMTRLKGVLGNDDSTNRT